MRIIIACVGKVKATYAREGVALFVSRLKRYSSVVIAETKDFKRGQQPLKKSLEAEAGALKRFIPKGSYTIGLDEHGPQWSSPELAQWLKAQRDRAQPSITFLLGGPDGFSPEFKKSFDRLWSLGAGTLPHELARVVLCEQLYRAESINAGHPYHRGRPDSS